MSISTNQFMSSPMFYPISMDFSHRVISFIRLSRDDYRDSAFLDSRAVRSNSYFYRTNVDDLFLYNAHVPGSFGLVHYILHPAFSCSTLLARYLDLIPLCFVLKEPVLLTLLASKRPADLLTLGDASRHDAMADWLNLLELVLELMKRRYSPSDVVIIKPHDGCNGLGELFLEHDHRSKIVFLSIALRTFLLSALKSAERRAWLQARLKRSAKDAAKCEQLAEVDPSNLTDAQAGAYLWMLNGRICRHLQMTAPDRVLALSGDIVADSPQAALTSVASFFGLRLDHSQLESILDDPSAWMHSKDSSLPCDPATRRRVLAEAEGSFGAEVQQGIEWAQRVGHDATLDWSLV
jgi:hypothetical protein